MPTLARQELLPIIPRAEFQIRTAVMNGGDVKFIDELQKLHSKMVGWFPLQQIETYVKNGYVLRKKALRQQGIKGSRDQGCASRDAWMPQCLDASPNWLLHRPRSILQAR